MKKAIKKGIGYILLGFIIGKIIFERSVFKNYMTQNNYYFLQEGIYNENTLEKSMSDIDTKMILQDQNNYYVYVGITKSKEVAKKIIKIYQLKGKEVMMEVKSLPKTSFDYSIREYDKLLQSTNNSDEMLTIEEVVLANYQKVLKNRT